MGEVTYRMYKELQINKKAKANNLTGNEVEELSGQFTEKDPQMVSDHSTLVQYAFQSGYHEADALSVGKKNGSTGNSSTVWVGMAVATPIWGNSLAVGYDKAMKYLSCDAAVPRQVSAQPKWVHQRIKKHVWECLRQQYSYKLHTGNSPCAHQELYAATWRDVTRMMVNGRHQTQKNTHGRWHEATSRRFKKRRGGQTPKVRSQDGAYLWLHGGLREL